MNTLRYGALLAICTVLGACQSTRVALADPHWGFEATRDGRSLSLSENRMLVRPDANPGSATLHLHSPGGTSHDHWRFELLLDASNSSDERWTIDTSMFTIAIKDTASGPKTCTLKGCFPGDQPTTVLASIPAGTGTRLTVPVTLEVPRDVDLRELERFELRLTIADRGENLLERRVLIGSFSQVTQVGRFAVVFSLALLALGAL